MLTFNTLLTYLDIEQQKLKNLYNQFITKTDENVYINYINKKYDDTFSLPESFIFLNKIFSDYYYVYTNNNKNSLIYSFLYCLDNNFVIESNKEDYINKFRKELCYDLENKNLYRKFNYVKLRKFKKDLMQKSLLDINKDIDEYIKQYIIDYFGINVYIFMINKDEKIKNTFHILSHNDSDESNPYKPTILLLNKNDQYYPILQKDGNSVLKYSENELVNILYENYVITKKVIKIKKSTDECTDECTNEYVNKSENINDLKPIKKMLLKDLQELASRYNIDIDKDSVNKDKKILKTKNELYNEIENIIKS